MHQILSCLDEKMGGGTDSSTQGEKNQTQPLSLLIVPPQHFGIKHGKKRYFHQSLFLRDDHQQLTALCGMAEPPEGPLTSLPKLCSPQKHSLRQ